MLISQTAIQRTMPTFKLVQKVEILGKGKKIEKGGRQKNEEKKERERQKPKASFPSHLNHENESSCFDRFVFIRVRVIFTDIIYPSKYIQAITYSDSSCLLRVHSVANLLALRKLKALCLRMQINKDVRLETTNINLEVKSKPKAIEKQLCQMYSPSRP